VRSRSGCISPSIKVYFDQYRSSRKKTRERCKGLPRLDCPRPIEGHCRRGRIAFGKMAPCKMTRLRASPPARTEPDNRGIKRIEQTSGV